MKTNNKNSEYKDLIATIDWLDNLIADWWSFIKDKLSMEGPSRYPDTSKYHSAEGCSVTILSLVFIWLIVSIVMLFFVEEKENAKVIGMWVVLAIVAFVFGGLLLVVLVDILLKLVLKILERNHQNNDKKQL